MIRPDEIRRPAVSGMFYPSDLEELRRDVRRMLKAAGKHSVPGTIRGIIAPHAGYMYSGETAACGYALVEGARFATVVIVSPSHREFFNGVSVYPGGGYQTPLGQVPIDQGLREDFLDAFSGALSSGMGHGEEHAIEVQLPFLQVALTGFSLLPLVIGNQLPETCFSLGEALGSLLRGKQALLVASTDLSHYYPAETANRLDGVMVDDVEAFDASCLMDDLQAGRTEACGGGPAVAVMSALRHLGVGNMKVLRHCNSGDVSGDMQAVVGYLSAVAYS